MRNFPLEYYGSRSESVVINPTSVVKRKNPKAVLEFNERGGRGSRRKIQTVKRKFPRVLGQDRGEEGGEGRVDAGLRCEMCDHSGKSSSLKKVCQCGKVANHCQPAHAIVRKLGQKNGQMELLAWGRYNLSIGRDCNPACEMRRRSGVRECGYQSHANS